MFILVQPLQQKQSISGCSEDRGLGKEACRETFVSPEQHLKSGCLDFTVRDLSDHGPQLGPAHNMIT